MFYVIGKSLKHTMSPFIHKCMGLDYGVVELENESDLCNFLQEKKFGGVNVTIPYKESVIKALDFVEEVANKVSAVNTIVNKDGLLFGYNTDVFGMEYALNHFKIGVENKTVLILGSGGTAKSANYLCQKSGAKTVNCVSRKGAINYQNCKEISAEIIINTTPVGMYPDNFSSPIDLSDFPNITGVFDAVYNPLKTKLIMQAEEKKIPCGNGLIMLVAQAAASARLFANITIDDNLIYDVYKKLYDVQKNIILVGMPGSGKSVVAKKLAIMLDKQLIDTDSEIEKKEGKTVAEIFAEGGESLFRKIENEVLENCLKNTNAVISTGGGSVISLNNRQKIRQSGFSVWIKRDIKLLAKENRPLSKSLDELQMMYQEREKFYQCADIFVNNVESELENTIITIRREYEKSIGY